MESMEILDNGLISLGYGISGGFVLWLVYDAVLANGSFYVGLRDNFYFCSYRCRRWCRIRRADFRFLANFEFLTKFSDQLWSFDLKKTP